MSGSDGGVPDGTGADPSGPGVTSHVARAFWATRNSCLRNDVAELTRLFDGSSSITDGATGGEVRVTEWRVCQPRVPSEPLPALTLVTRFACGHVETLLAEMESKTGTGDAQPFTDNPECVMCELVRKHPDNLDAVRFLLQRCGPVDVGAVPDIEEGRCIIETMIIQGHIELAKMAAKECKVKTTLPRGSLDRVMTTMQASGAGMPMIKRFMSEWDSNIKAHALVTPNSLLQAACRGGHTEIVRFLLLECQVKHTGEVFEAMKHGHLETLTCLVTECGIGQDGDSTVPGHSLFKAAIAVGQVDQEAWISESVKKIEYLRAGSLVGYVCRGPGTNHLALVTTLVNAGLDPKAASNDVKRSTPLLWAAEVGHIDVLKYLVTSCGCDPHQRSLLGDTALMSACYRGFLDVAKYLVDEFNVDCYTTSTSGVSTMHLACSGGHLEVVKWLGTVAPDFKIDTPTEKGYTALYFACRAGWLPVAKHLIENLGADPNQKSAKGSNALVTACKNGHLAVAKYLVDECKVAVIPDACTVAARGGHVAIVKHMLGPWRRLLCDPAGDSDEDSDPVTVRVDVAMTASAYGGLEVVRFALLEAGPLKNVPAESLAQITQKAAFRGHYDLVVCMADRCHVDISLIRLSTMYTAASQSPECVTSGFVRSLAFLRVRGAQSSEGDELFCPRALEPFQIALATMSPLEIALATGLLYEVHWSYLRAEADLSWKQRGVLMAIAADPPLWGFPPNTFERNLPALAVYAEAAAVPWSPRFHMLHHRGVREAITTLMLVQWRLAEVELADTPTQCPLLPIEMWLHILTFIRRSHFPYKPSAEPF